MLKHRITYIKTGYSYAPIIYAIHKPTYVKPNIDTTHTNDNIASFGSTSFMDSPPIDSFPEVISSSPATILKAVDFPQPEGPTKTRNSPSAISMLRPSTALKPFG